MATIDQLIDTYAQRNGLDPAMLRAFVRIESGGNPNAKTGSYSGLLQLSREEFEKYGGGDIFNPEDNLRAGAAKLAAEQTQFANQYGRAPTATDLYLKHQQGPSGYAAHQANPGGTAWENIRPYYSDAAAKRKGFASGDDYAKAAVWGNVPDDVKARYGSVENITSGDFVSLWDDKVGRFAGQPQQSPTQTSEAKPMFDIAMLAKLFMGGGGPAAGASPAAGSAAAAGRTLPSAANPGTDMQNLFGSLGNFAPGGQGGTAQGQQQQQMAGADSSLAAQAMQNAQGSPSSGMQMQQRPVDMSRLSQVLQNAGQLGIYRPRRSA